MERGGKMWKEAERGGESISIWKTSLTLAWGAGAGGTGHLKCKYRTTTTYLTPHTSPTGRDTGGDRAGHLMGEAVGSVGSLTSLSLILPPANLLSLLTLSAYY